MARDDSNIPTWDGLPEGWEKYEIKIDNFCDQAERWKEPQQIAKLLSRLTGNAEKLFASLSEVERRKVKDRTTFKSYLKRHLLEQAVPELGKNFRAWVKLKRNPREGMRLFVLRHRQVLNKVESSLNETEAGDSLSKKLREMIDKNKLEIMVAERTARVKGKMKTFPGKGKGIQRDGLPKGKTYKHSTGRVWGPQSRRTTEVTEEEEEWWDEEEEEEEEREEDDAWDWDHRSNQSGKSKESKGSQKPKGKSKGKKGS